MNVQLFTNMFDEGSSWHGPCVVIVDAQATVQTSGPDSLMTGGVKVYAPRLTSGRIEADAVCFSKELGALFIVQQHRHQLQTGEEELTQMLTVVDCNAVVGLEFQDLKMLEGVGISPPTIEPKREYRKGTLVG